MLSENKEFWGMKLGIVRMAIVAGLVLSVAGCDKCGHLDLTGVAAPKTCSDARAR
jgi:hypothetical protein